MTSLETRIKNTIRDVPDFPKKGIIFKDICPVLQDGKLFADIIESYRLRYKDQNIDAIVGIESRGFIFGAPLATALGIGLVLIRKPGKLPAQTLGIDYALEYGTDRLEIHADALAPNARVILIDDLLATGGTIGAAAKLLSELQINIVETAFLIELAFLEGHKTLGQTPYHSLVSY